jgi:hypothetical protein
MKGTQKRTQEYKIMFITEGCAIIAPQIPAIASQKYRTKHLADAFCAGVNAFREARPTHKREGNYIVMYA